MMELLLIGYVPLPMNKIDFSSDLEKSTHGLNGKKKAVSTCTVDIRNPQLVSVYLFV